jgi:hypothetical protein
VGHVTGRTLRVVALCLVVVGAGNSPSDGSRKKCIHVYVHLFLLCDFDAWALLLGLYGRCFYIVSLTTDILIRLIAFLLYVLYTFHCTLTYDPDYFRGADHPSPATPETFLVGTVCV